MANQTIGTSHSASVQDWLDKTFRGHLTTNMFSNLMGKGAGAAIRMDDTKKSAGDKYTYHFDDHINLDEWVSGGTQLEGNAKEYALSTDNVTLDIQRVARLIRGFSMSQLRTNVDLQARVKSLFSEGMAAKVQDMIITALTDTTSGRVQQRYLYGAANSNWNATHTTALGNVDATNDKLSLASISMARRKAVLESNSVGKMLPVSIKTLNGRDVKKYVLLAHEYAIRDLLTDSTAVTALNQRNKEMFNVISGADYVGEHDGVLIYKTQLDKMISTGTGAAGIDVTHNLLLGAGSSVISYGLVDMPDGMDKDEAVKSSDGKAVLTSQVGDHGQKVETGLTFVAGAKKLVDNTSGTAQDFGCVHLFNAGVAD